MRAAVSFIFACFACSAVQGADSAPVVPSTEILANFEKAEKRRGVVTRSIAQPVRTTTRSIAGPPLDARGIQIVPKNGETNVEVRIVPDSAQNFQNILFELGSTRFADEATQRQVLEIAKAMKAKPELRFLVEGHTCDLGDEVPNKLLSEQRAETVRTYLLREGVAPEQVFTLGFGESARAVENTSEENRAKNRRVAVYLRDWAK